MEDLTICFRGKEKWFVGDMIKISYKEYAKVWVFSANYV